MTNNPPLVVFSDDWGRHPSSCQHLVRELLSRREVLWFNTIGTRPPRLDLYTLRRGLGKLAGWLRPGQKQVDNGPAPKVVQPLMWPSFQGRLARGLNRRLLAGRIAKELGDREAVFITTVPIVADLVDQVPAKRWVYYCVDDFGVWPGLDGETLRVMEADLARKVDRAVAASDVLQRRLADLGRSSTVLTHGVDHSFWNSANGTTTSSLDGLEKPVVLFWGLVDRRLNAEWLARLANSITTGTIALVGPQQDPNPEITGLKRVRLLGQVAYQDLPVLARSANVLVMPYADLPVTRAMQPLKFKEYLATGKPVVAARLPATEEWADAADLVTNADDLIAAVHERIAAGTTSAQLDARRRLTTESWSAKAQTFERLCLGDAS